jgi:catechol 2,3-dioxygenase-like lactoylglutathione lyase family enzyme
MIQTTSVDLFAGMPVTDYAAALAWYEQLLGSPPAFIPDDTEAVWELAEHRFVYIDVRPEHAGHAMTTIFVADLDALVALIAERGIDPVEWETYDNGVRKITYRDPDGNEIGFGGAPL